MELVFLAQLTCQFPRETPSMVLAGVLNQELDLDSWAAGDITRRLEMAIRHVLVTHSSTVILVLNHFDSLSGPIRVALLRRFGALANVSECRLKLVIATRCRDPNIADHVPTTLLTPLEIPGLATSPRYRFLRSLNQARPELFLEESNKKVIEDAKHVTGTDPVARFIIQEQLYVQREPYHTLALSDNFGPELPIGPWDDWTLARLVDRLVKAGDHTTRDRNRATLKWVLYGLRPLTTQEWATVLFITETPPADIGRLAVASVSQDTVTTYLRELSLSLAGIVVIRDNELWISHPRVRSILVGTTVAPPEGEESEGFFWDDLEATAHFDMAELCLQYLARPAVQELVKKRLRPSVLGHDDKATVSRRDLCSYSLVSWVEHYKRLGVADRARLAGLLPSDASLTEAWACEHWAVSNWVAGGKNKPQTLLPILSSIGVLDVVQSKDPTELRLALLVAISMGQTEAASALIRDNTFADETVTDALIAATGAGFQELALDLAKRIILTRDPSMAPSATIMMQRPPFELLVRKASLSGMTGLVELLLGAQGAPEYDQTTAVMEAAASHNTACFELVLKSSPAAHKDKVAKFLEGLGDVEIFKCFLSVAPPDFRQHTAPGYGAAISGHFGVLQELLLAGLDAQAAARVNPLLHAAVGDGNPQCATLLLRHGAQPNQAKAREGGQTPLMAALVGGRMEACRVLLGAGALPDPGGRGPDNPLLQALKIHSSPDSEKHGWELLELLLDNGADPNAKDEDGSPVLFISRSLRVYELFLDRGFDVNLRDQEGQTPLHHAAMLGRHDLSSLFLSRRSKVNLLTNDGRSCLYCAVPFPIIVRHLLSKGVDASLGQYKTTPLMYAASSPQFLESLRVILETQPPLEIRYPVRVPESTSGTTAFNFAAEWGCPEGIVALAEAGADINNVDNNGIPPLHRAALQIPGGGEKNLDAILSFLYRLNINATDDKGRSALHLDLSLSRMKSILRMGAEANIQDKEGNTPLHRHAVRGQEDAIKLLVRHGADLNTVNAYGHGPLVNAIRAMNTDMVKTLVLRGANIKFSSEGWLGGPLTAAFFPFAETADPRRRRTEMLQCLMALGADVNATGGLLGRPINAALVEDPRMMALLLKKGAQVDLVDDMGRSPIHFATTREVDDKDLYYFPAIIHAGGDRLARDGLGRTTLHWAALHKQPLVANYILSTFPDKEARARFANSPDAGGWTALAFALCASWHEPDRRMGEIPADRGEVVKVLMAAGADGEVAATSEGKTWTLLRIADYECVPADVLKLIDPRVVEKGGHREHENEPGFGRGYWRPKPLHPKKKRCCVCVQVSRLLVSRL